VLELWRQQPEHPTEVAVVPERRRHQVVALVDDQQVPGKVGRALRSPAGCEKLLKDIVLR